MDTDPKAQVDLGVRAPGFGEPAPFFTARTSLVERYSLEAAAGRWIVLMIFGTLAFDASLFALEHALGRRELFDDLNAAFFGVSVDPADEQARNIADSEPGVRFFWDFDHAISRRYGVADEANLKPTIFLIDPSFRILLAEPIERTPMVLDRLAFELENAPVMAQAPTAPVLILPRVFEPDLCVGLIDYYRRGQQEPSGFAVDMDGRTVLRADDRLKRRTDVTIAEEALVDALTARLETRLFPMVRRAFGWRPTHIERFLLCRYGAEDKGFFFPHRDDATAGTAHRRFAVSVNLNAEDHEGGDLCFPEFGPRTYRPPTGGAAVFSCSLLHEAQPVIRGERFVFVPFLYDAEGEALRAKNMSRVG